MNQELPSENLPSKEESEQIKNYAIEGERIQKTLERFLNKKRAHEVAEIIYDLALQIDANINALLKYPKVLKSYNYDGEFFEPKDGFGFHKACNGLAFLRGAASSHNIELFLGSYKIKDGEEQAINSMLNWFRVNYVWVAKARLLNWKERGEIGLVFKEVLRESIEDHKAREKELADKIKVDPLSESEQDFFKLYEEEMGLRDDEVEGWLKKVREDGYKK